MQDLDAAVSTADLKHRLPHGRRDFPDRLRHENLEVLESPRQAMSSQHIGTSTSDFYPAQTNRSALGRIDAGHDVEQCTVEHTWDGRALDMIDQGKKQAAELARQF
jgi:hypothetical protein